MYIAIIKSLDDDAYGKDLSGIDVPMALNSMHVVSKDDLGFYKDHPDVFQLVNVNLDTVVMALWDPVLGELVNPVTGAAVPVGGSTNNHNALTNLATGDVHTQYAYLLGRVGGQTLTGGTAASSTLTLSSTSNATKGKIFLSTTSAYDEANHWLGVGVSASQSTLDVRGLPGPHGGFSLRQNPSGSAYFKITQVDTLGTTMGDNYNFTAFGAATTLGSGVLEEYVRIAPGGKVSFGHTNPTATIHPKAGSAAAASAPIKLIAGTVMTTPEAGAFEFDGTNLFFTVGALRKTVTLT